MQEEIVRVSILRLKFDNYLPKRFFILYLIHVKNTNNGKRIFLLTHTIPYRTRIIRQPVITILEYQFER